MSIEPANANGMRKNIKSKTASKTQEELDAQLRILKEQLAEKEKLVGHSKTKIYSAERAEPQQDHQKEDLLFGLKQDLLISETECSSLQDEINVIVSRRKELQTEMLKQQEQYEFVSGMVKDLHKKEELVEERKHFSSGTTSGKIVPCVES